MTLTWYMPERLHQFRFDAQFGPADPQDITPARFTGLRFPARRPEQQAAQLGRFMRQVREDFLDHIVVGRDCWVSLTERRLGFE